MDAISHALVTAALYDSPLAVVASAVNLRYNEQGLQLLRAVLPEQYAAFAAGIESHIVANSIVHEHPLFHELWREARPIVQRNGVFEKLSHPITEAVIDSLLLDEAQNLKFVRENWAQFDWAAAQDMLPQFSRYPESAARAIGYVRQRPSYDSQTAVAQWIRGMEARFHRPVVDDGRYERAAVELREALGNKQLHVPFLLDVQKQVLQRLRT